MNEVELTILMPCLNEAETLATCIQKAQSFLDAHGVSGEVLIADNGSTDGSQEIAKGLGARVVDVPQRGYGAALIGGTNAARGRYTVMGDADDSYDFTALLPFLERLRAGDDLVMGNRFAGGIERGAMPWLHKYVGNPVLSLVGRVFFRSRIRDFHCGLRGYNTERMRALELKTLGMEFASEMVVQATLRRYAISEVPTTLAVDGRSRPPHLRSFRDGWRHLKFLLMHAPNWLFLYPGIICFVIGLIATAALTAYPVRIQGVTFDINTLLYAILLMIVGVNAFFFAVFTKVYAMESGFIPVDKRTQFLCDFTANRGAALGAVLIGIGIAVSIFAILVWKDASFGPLNPESMMRVTLPALAVIVIGIQCIFAGFFVDILRIKSCRQ